MTGDAPTDRIPVVPADPPTDRIPFVPRPAPPPPGERVAEHRSPGRRPRSGWWTLAVVLAFGAVTAALRLYHQAQSYELFIDEIQYADVGNSFAAGRGPELFDQPFFLHPPLFFAVVGAAIGTPAPHLSTPFVLGLRWVDVVFATANVVLVMALARRVAGMRAAVVAAALYALDPFVVRFDSRLMLEAPMFTGVLVGVVALTYAIDRIGRARTGLFVLAGVATGLAVTTKSTAALVTALPMLISLVTGRVVPCRDSAVVLGTQSGVYGLYVLVVALTGEFPAWYEQTFGGVARAVGVVTQTGFNSAGAPSFTDRLLAQLGQFGPSYAMFAVSSAWIGWQTLQVLLRRRPGTTPAFEVFVLWTAAVAAAVAYTFVFAEIEEQTFYLYAVPATVVVGVAVARLRRGATVATAGAIPLLLAGSAAVWFHVHTVPDDAYRRLDAFLAPPSGTGVVLAVAENTAQFVTPRVAFVGVGEVLVHIGTDDGPQPRYLLVSTQLTQLGLAPIGPETIAAMRHRYPVAFSATGRTVGELILFDLQGDPQ